MPLTLSQVNTAMKQANEFCGRPWDEEDVPTEAYEDKNTFDGTPYISPYDRRYLHLGGDPAQVFTDPDHLRMWQEMTEKEKEIADTDTEAQ